MAVSYTDEQLAVIQSTGNRTIEAVAGSGKTATLIGYAIARPNERILFLSFNRSTAVDARSKFKNCGCHNVRVETVHSLAFRELVISRRRNGLAADGSLSLQDIVDYCGIETSANTDS